MPLTRAALTRAALARGAAPLRDGRFRGLLLAMAVSALGSSGTLVALSWLVAVELDAAALLSLVLAGYTVPQFVAGLVGGALADRYGTLALSRASFAVSGLTLLAMWLLGRSGALGVGAVTGLVVLAGAAVAVAQPATGALLVSIVDERELGPANMLRVTATDTAAVLGPVAAGVTIAGFGAHAWFLVDAVTFLVAAAILPRPRRTPASAPASEVSVPASAPSSSPAGRGARRHVADAAAGMVFVLGRFRLWTGMAAAGLGNLLITVPLLVAIPTLAGAHELGSGALGWFFALFTAGSVAGAAEAGLVSRARPMLAALACLSLAGAGVGLIGASSDLPVLLCLAFVVGFCVADFDVRWSVYLQGSVPHGIVGRVLAADAWVSFVCRTIGLSTIGLVAVRHPSGLLVVCGLVLALLAAALAITVERRRT